MKKYIEHPRVLPAAFVAALLFSFTCPLSAVTLQGNPFTPSGADFQIFALQEVDAAHPLGNDSFHPQVNTDFEFTPSIGVSYDKGNGSLTNFGLGLYQAGTSTFSTGLNIRYNQPTDAYSVTVTVMDFDIKSGAAFFNNQKVEPGLILLGANNSVFASLTPTDIFPYLTPHSTGGKKGTDDVWDINFSQLLSGLHIADGSITGFVLYADQGNGEKANSDPYLLLSVGAGIPSIPEPSTYFAGLSAVGFALLHARQVRRRKSASKVAVAS
jgi:hypothetical protein